MYLIYRSYLVLILLSFATGLSVLPGLNYYDTLLLLSVIIIIIWQNFNIAVGYFFIHLFILVFLPFLVSGTYQIFAAYEASTYTFYIPYNIVILFIYLTYFKYIPPSILPSPKFLLIIMLIPIILSLVTFVNSSALSIMSRFYDIQIDYFGRYGGIWGRDAVQLGYYASVVMLVSSYLVLFKNLPFSIFFIAFSTCLVTVFISGTRVGLIAYIVSFFMTFLLIGYHYVNVQKVFLLFVALSVFTVSVVNYFDFDITSVTDRFDLFLLFDQLTGKSGGHLGEMYPKWLNQWGQESNPFKLLFSFDPEWKYPDSFILFLIANGGLLCVVTFILFCSVQIYRIYFISNSPSKMFLIHIFIFLCAVSVKGNFVVNNFSMFLFVLVYYLLEKDDKRNKSAE